MRLFWALSIALLIVSSQVSSTPNRASISSELNHYD
jgi:hypothetical protein